MSLTKSAPRGTRKTTWSPKVVGRVESELTKRLHDDAELRHALQRDVSSELAEQLIRLRRYRGLSQQELAEIIGTKQTAISRHESGAGNISVKTLESILEALRAVCRVDLIPEEMEGFRESFPRWWIAEADSRLTQSTSTFFTSLDAAPATVGVAPCIRFEKSSTDPWSTLISAFRQQLASGPEAPK